MACNPVLSNMTPTDQIPIFDILAKFNGTTVTEDIKLGAWPGSAGIDLLRVGWYGGIGGAHAPGV